tara:strand:+ start:213 stop:659 length:447 start_codon:yes stop_codon:yes gene_type:complete
MSHWLYKEQILEEAPEGAFGFVYLITNNKSGKMYIGRKYFGKTRRVKKKGSKRRKVIRKDSDWRTYIGSSKTLQESINKNKNNFKFEILAFGKTKGQVNYIEENLHHKFHVSVSEEFYNDCIGPRRFARVSLDKSTINAINKVKLKFG